MEAAIKQTEHGLKGFSRIMGVLAVAVGTLLIAIDQFIVNVSVSTISGELGVSNNNGAWSITAYTTASAVAIPLTGWLTARIGRIRLLTLSAFLFAFTSFLCGTADTLGQLVFYRILQGIVGGPLIPLSQSLLLILIPNKGVAMGIFGMVVMVGPVIGPVLGGWITYDYGWRPIFYINVPIGIFVGIVVGTILSHMESKKEKVPPDVIGIVLLFFSVGAYQIVMNKGYDWAWFSDSRIRFLTIIAVICGTFLVAWEWFHERPAVNFRFFKDLDFTIALVIMTPVMAIVFCNLVIGPLWVQANLGYDQLWAGFTLAPLGITASIVFPIVGRLLTKIDVRIFVVISLVIMASAFYWMSCFTITTDFRTMAYSRMLLGVGFAMCYPPMMLISITNIAPAEMPSAAGVFSFARMLGLGFGISYGTNYFYTRENFFQERYVSYIIPSNYAYAPYMEILKEKLGIVGQRADQFLYNMVFNQASTEVFLQTCYLSAILLLSVLPLLLFVRPPKAAHQ
ncbi:MAG: DHA2 family efflux MFS transporter permease subunit [Chlamydiales bacterium]